jgi:hypothetical protein
MYATKLIIRVFKTEKKNENELFKVYCMYFICSLTFGYFFFLY